MPKPLAIHAVGLSKRYRLGEYITFGRSLGETLGDLFHRLRRGAARDSAADDGYLWALRDVDLKLEPGDTLGVIGRNGSGKSTLLKILSRITYPTSGHADVRGRVRSLLEVGTGMHPELTGRENIYLNGTIMGMKHKEVERKFDAIVEFSGVERFLDTPLKRYSTGMRVRLGFSVAAHLDPDILLVDEVLSVGDADFRNRCVGKMERVAGSGRTVVFVSHNLQAVRNLCRRAIWLKDGAVERRGLSGEVIAAYLSDSLQASFDGNITTEMHWNESPRLDVVRVELINEDQQQSNSFLLGEQIRLRILYRVHDPDHQYRIGLLVRSFDGTVLAVSLSQDHLESLRLEPGMLHELDVTLENRLNSGQFLLEINIKADRAQEDRIEGVDFTVEATRRDEGPPPRAGILQMPAAWTQLTSTPDADGES